MITKSEPSEKVTQEWTACMYACPVHTDVRRYVECIARGDYDGAFEIIRQVNPIPSVCSRICHHPCEQECRRNDVDQPIAIRDLKRFAVEAALEGRKGKVAKKPITKKEKIAIVGAGPAGLAAADRLLNNGYSVTLFERSDMLGGLLAKAIPMYRLPNEVLKIDADNIVDQGIDVKTGCEIGKDISMDDLKKDYDAILLAVGLSISRGIPLPGSDAKDVMLALPFLEKTCTDQPVSIGKQVIVIGGGNVAVDVARSARRLGAEEVKMVCLESKEEMPAWSWEQEEALEEGISIIYSRGPNQILLDDGGRVTGLEVKEVESVFDKEGRFSPTFHDDRISVIEGDMVIIAIGQQSDLSLLEKTDIERDERGRLTWNDQTCQTSDSKVFASGEVVTGPGSAIEAVASGQRAAEAIDYFLRGKNMSELSEEIGEKILALPEDVVEKIRCVERHTMPTIAACDRIKNFEAFELGFDEGMAKHEARRCLLCGAGAEVDAEKCAVCLTCVRICPFDAPYIEAGEAKFPAEKCQACGLCALECPASAITMKGFDIHQVEHDLKRIFDSVPAKQKDPVVIAISCDYHRDVDDAPKINVEYPPNVYELLLPCTSRLDVLDLLKAFELGADAVYVVTCASGQCRFVDADMRTRRRVERARQILEEIGLGADRIGVYEVNYPPNGDLTRIANEANERAKELGRTS